MLRARSLPARPAPSRHTQLACSSSTIRTVQRRTQSNRQHTKHLQYNRNVVSEPPQQRNGAQRQLSSPSIAVPAVGMISLQYFLAGGSAYAAKVCLDVPEWVADFDLKDAVCHSPVFAIGAAILALLLFPKVIKFSIKYLAIPAIIALLGWLAISHPQATANSVYTVLEFVKEHPAAASIGIIAAAGIILGPDLLAGAAVAGVAVLLAVQAGVVQLPSVQIPRLPGQQLVAKQIDRAGKVIRLKISDLDDDDLSRPSSSSSTRQRQMQSQKEGGDYRSYEPSSSSSSSGSSTSRMQLSPMRVPTIVDNNAAASPPQQQLSLQQQQQQPAPQSIDQSPKQLSPVEQLKSAASQLRNTVDQARKRVGSQLQEAEVADQMKIFRTRVQESQAAQGLGKAALSLGDSVQESQAVQGLGKSIKGLSSRVRGLSDRVQDASAVQGLRDTAAMVGAGVLNSVQEGAGALQGRLLQQRQQTPQQQQQQAVGGAGVDRGNVTKGGDQARSRPVDSILANS